MEKINKLIVLILLLVLVLTGCVNKSNQLIEAGIVQLEKEDFENALELFDAAIEEDRNSNTILFSKMANDYIEIFNTYKNFLEIKENRFTEINALELGDGDDLFNAKKLMDKFHKNYNDLEFDFDLADELSTNIDNSLKEEIEYSIILFEYKVALNPYDENYLLWYDIVKENLNQDYMTEEQSAYVNETIIDRIPGNEYYPLTYIDENEEMLKEMFESGPIDKDFVNIRNGIAEEKEREEQRKKEEEQAKKRAPKKNVVRENFDPNNVPIEYCCEFDKTLAIEMVSDFYGTSNVNIIGNNSDCTVFTCMVKGNKKVDIHMRGKIVEYK